jgi:hypothetical protein
VKGEALRDPSCGLRQGAKRSFAWRCLRALAAAAALVSACGSNPPPGSVLEAGRQPSPEIAEACDLAARRCSRCHPIERLLLARVTSPAHWAYYVERMRHQPESGISEGEGKIIVRCLVFHSFGEEVPR